jgi:3-phenylpropionate/cinnamic acid dioxygenase small subunit
MSDLALDKIALSELMHRQAMAIDTHDWTAYRACLADEIDFDFTEHLDSVATDDVPRATRDPDVWTKAAGLSEGFDATFHLVLNQVHEVDGDYARTVCYMVNEHRIDDCSYTSYQRHWVDSIRTAEGWKLYRRRAEDVFGRGNPEVLKLAPERAAARARR